MQCNAMRVTYLDPMKGEAVLYAPRGEGCDVLIMWFFRPLILLHLSMKFHEIK